MHNDLDTSLSRIAERAGGTARLRPVTQIRARGDRRRIQHRAGTVALSVGAVGLTVVGVAAVVGDGGTGGGNRTPVLTSPTPTASPTSISENMLLGTTDLNRVGRGWQQTSTNRTDDGTLLRCQRDTLASLGATEVLVRTFRRSGLDDVPLEAGQLIAYLPSAQAAEAANNTLFQWMQTCGEYATGGGGKLAKVGGDFVAAVQGRSPDGPGSGAAWQLMFDDDQTDDNAWIDSIGVGTVGQYLTIVTYGDWGQDANYEPGQTPGEVLLPDAFAKLPS